MPAEVTWNGIAKSYRVGKYNFVQNRMQIVDDAEVIGYLKTTKGFTVIDKAAAPAPKAPAKTAPATAAAVKPEAEPEAEPDESTDDEPKKPVRGPRTRRPPK